MISKTMQTILHALSYGNIEVEASRRLADIKKLDAMRIFVKKLDTKVYNGAYEVPVRLYFPSEEAMSCRPQIMLCEVSFLPLPCHIRIYSLLLPPTCFSEEIL